MICLDTNVVIAAAKGELDSQSFVGHGELIYPSVVRIEALGYHGMGSAEERGIRRIFATAYEASLSAGVIERAIELRQSIRMSLPDAIIAATAMLFDAELWTANTRDFQDIIGLKLHNPLAGE